MTARLVAIALAFALTLSLAVALAAPAPADAARTLSPQTAKRHATREAQKRAAADPSITQWTLARGFRFTSRKFVFVWWANMSDGRVCMAQLVTRYRSSKTNKLISYFRLDSCS